MISSIAKLLQDLQAKEEAKFAPEPITHAPATSPKGETLRIGQRSRPAAAT